MKERQVKIVNQAEYLNKIIQMAEGNGEIASVWLYGSRARNTHSNTSDYDIAVLFSSFISDPLERRLRPEQLSMEWSQACRQEVNIVDISLVHLPLAMTVLNDNQLLFDGNTGLRLRFEQSIMSKWELDYLYNEARYA